MLSGNRPLSNWITKRVVCLVLLGVVGCQSVPVDIAAPHPTANFNTANNVLESGRTTYVSFFKCGMCHRPKPVYDYTPEAWANDILPRMAPKARLKP
jgi:hypothetical protein